MSVDETSFWKRRQSRRSFTRAAAAAGMLLGAGPLLAACGSADGDDGDQKTPAATSSGATSTGSSISEFIVANEAEPADLLPYFGSYSQVLVTRNIYQTLVEPRMTLRDDGSVEITYTAMLAESFEQVEPGRWRFPLRPGVKFHNGEDWDAAAAKASFDAMTDPDVAASLNKNVLLDAEMEVVDDMTVDIIFPGESTEIFVRARIGFAGLPPKLLAEQGLAGFAENPVGTGPFKFQSWTRGQDIKLTKFEEYWDADATNIPALTFIPRPDPGVRALTIRAGEAHMAYNIGGEQASSLERKVIGGGFQSSSIRLNNAIAPTNDIRVRKAINYAINREAIAEALFAGTATPIGFFAFQPVNVEPYPYDPDEAKRLIEEAGANGMELEFVYGENRVPEEPQMVEYYKSQLEEIGLSIKLTRLEPRQYNDVGGLPFDEQPPLFMETTSSGNFGDSASGLQDKYGCDGSGTFCNEDMDARFAELSTLQGGEKAAALQTIAEELQNEFVPRCWVVGVQQVHGLAAGVETDLPLNAYILFDDIRLS